MPLSAADVRPANACNSASKRALATVPDSCYASIVLFLSVCVPVSVATVLSMLSVASPDVAPPERPVPAITAVISP